MTIRAKLVWTLVMSWAAFAEAPPATQVFPLSDAKDLVPVNVTLEPVEYKGRKAVRLTKGPQKDGFALLRGTDFQDGVIEGEIAVKITAPPGGRMPGFSGIAFRAKPDLSGHELFYLRPGNSTSEDQSMRNHSAQYSSEPNFGWYKLRREWPWVYEAWADLQTESWTKVRIEVKGRVARLFLNGSEKPTLLVDGLKGEDLHGAVALWGYAGEETYFSNFRVVNAAPAPVKNGSDAAGSWQVKFGSDAGMFDSTMQLNRDGTQVTGTWSGGLGNDRAVHGMWRNGYVELSFDADWKPPMGGDPVKANAVLAGWIDGDTASGRMSVQGKADGRWTATRK